MQYWFVWFCFTSLHHPNPQTPKHVKRLHFTSSNPQKIWQQTPNSGLDPPSNPFHIVSPIIFLLLLGMSQPATRITGLRCFWTKGNKRINKQKHKHWMALVRITQKNNEFNLFPHFSKYHIFARYFLRAPAVSPVSRCIVTMGRGSQEWDVWFPTIPMISQMGSYIYICI